MSAPFKDVLKCLRAKDISVREQVPASTLCTFRIGGPATVIEPRCIGELTRAVMLCQRAGVPYEVIGKGSDLLFGDDPILPLLIRTPLLDGMQMDEDGTVTAHSGVSLPLLARRAAERGLDGLSFAAGIPGTLGGALYMNAGAYGKSIGECIKSVEILDVSSGKIRTVFKNQLNCSYRKLRFQGEKTIFLSATLQLESGGDPAAISAEMRRLMSTRAASQPLGYPSAGSVFRRPAPHIQLSKILDEMGFKGKTIGGAAVSEKHAGFIINKGNATARDVLALMRDIQNTVEREKGFRPQPEICLIPKDYELLAFAEG